MNRTQKVGVGLTGVGILGYALGIYVPYEGRAFSVTAVMVGITLFAIGNATNRGSSS